MRFIVDAQLPPALARWLTAQGYEAEHVFDVGLAEAPDAVIWRRATENVAVVVSKDDDFALRAQMGTDLCALVPSGRRRTGSDSVPPWSRLDPDD